jgi:hypothetical protein
MKRIVGIDTQTLIWGMPYPSKPRPTQDVAEMRRRAGLLFRSLQEQEATVIIPTVVVSEFLAGIAPEKRGDVLSNLSSRFHCVSFDVLASDLAATLWDKTRPLPRTDLPQQRQVLKADILIVATAKIAGATWFYSHEAPCRKLAELAEMEGKNLPTHAENLFEQTDR